MAKLISIIFCALVLIALCATFGSTPVFVTLGIVVTSLFFIHLIVGTAARPTIPTSGAEGEF